MNQLRQTGSDEAEKNTLTEEIDGLMQREFIKCVKDNLLSRELNDCTSDEELGKLRKRIENLKDMLQRGRIINDDTGNTLTNDQVKAMIEFMEYQVNIREQFETPVDNGETSDQE